MLPIYGLTLFYSLKGDSDLISKDELFSLYQKFVFYSYDGNLGFGYCSELNLTDEPSVTLYSVQEENKFRFLKIHDFDFIKSKSLEELIEIFN